MRIITSVIIGRAFIIVCYRRGIQIKKGFYSRKSMDLKSAYAQLKEDENTVRTYLTGNGIQNNEIVFSSVNINREFKMEDQLARNFQSPHFKITSTKY